MEFSTFCVTTDQISTAIAAGATHLILEDPKVGVRTFCEDEGSPDRLATLVHHARGVLPDILLSLNIDMLPHVGDIPLVVSYVTVARTLGIPRIRLQDPGLVRVVRRYYPEAVCHLATETGNANVSGMHVHATMFQRQCFSLDTAYPDMQKVLAEVSGEFEIVVQGPILIQYSQRRFLHGISDQVPDAGAVFAARDMAYPGRLYRFYDNPHGHLMYLYFDRCLLSCVADLRTLPVQSWLIDSRGESLAYLQEALTLYRQAATMPLLGPLSATVLQTLSGRPQRPGFFRANLTDQDRSNALPTTDILGHVVDVIKSSTFTVLVESPFSVTRPLCIVTPEGKRVPLRMTTPIRHVEGHAVTAAVAGDLLQFSWQKGVSSQSVLVFIEDREGHGEQ